LIAIGLVVLIQLAWTYLPFTQALFEAEGLGLLHWGLILGAGLGLFLAVELEKWLLRRFHLVADERAASNASAEHQQA